MSDNTTPWGVSGNYNQVTFLYEADEKDFFSPLLDDYRPERFESPANANSIADKIIQRRLIILGGDTSSDKHALARHFAWLVQEKLTSSGQRIAGHAKVTVYEWKRSGARFVDRALETYSERCIFVLPNLLPQHISYDLHRLIRLARQRHLIIITTDDSSLWNETFQETSDSKLLGMFWEDLASNRLYDRKQLTRTLVLKLLERKADLPPILIQNISSSNQMRLLGQIRPDQVADRLETPENVDYFVTLLAYEAQHGAITEATIEACIEAVRDDTRRIQQWYNALDTTRDRLLVLALNFFDGMADDQFFAALETLIEQAWHQRDPSLRALDYHDFERLQRFFRYVSLKEGRAIKTQLRDQRQKLIKVAWKSHRRHILSARPVFFELIRRSVQQEADNWELYGSSDRRDQLRKALSETISDIGLQSAAAIEDILLRLAVNPHVGVQAVAARAVARWREYNASPATFATLKRWMSDNDIEKSIAVFLSQTEREKRDEPKTYLKCTIALAIGYAAQSDRPNKMHRSLYSLLEQLSTDGNKLVLTSLCRFTLPMVAQLHLDQIENIVLTLTRHVEQHAAIAKSMRAAYFKQSAEVQATVERWHAWCLTNYAQSQTNRVVSYSTLLACVAQIYGELPYDQVSGGMTVVEAFHHLREILELVGTPLVREQALRSAIGLSRDHFAQLQDLIPSVTAEEMAQIVDKLIEIYLEQRAQLVHGERRWYHRPTDTYYPIWISGQLRPYTEIELEMLAWMRDDRNVVAQQIGVRALATFVSILDLAESHYIASLQETQRRRRQARQTEKVEPRHQRVGLYTKTIYRWYIIPWIVAPLSRRYRSIIRGVLPEVIRQDRVNRDVMRFLLYDWRALEHQEIPEIAKRLEQAIFWDSRLGRWMLFGIMLLFFSYVLARVVGTYWPNIAPRLVQIELVLLVLWSLTALIWWIRDRR